MKKNNKEIEKDLKDAGAILEGHFILSSGLHSSHYIQCARVMMDAKRGERLCQKLADVVRDWIKKFGVPNFDVIVAPAMGGVVVGYEMGRQLTINTMFCERVDGKFTLRRGFELQEKQRVLIIEDVVTTGKSTMETAVCIQSYGAIPIAVACLIDRMGNSTVWKASDFDLPVISLLEINAPTYKPDALPPELQKIPAIKPGSRDLKTQKSPLPMGEG